MSEHFMERCEHGTVGKQCRCPAGSKSVRLIPCPSYCPNAPKAEAPRIVPGDEHVPPGDRTWRTLICRCGHTADTHASVPPLTPSRCGECMCADWNPKAEAPPAPVQDFGPGSAYQIEGEENGRRLLSSAPPAPTCPNAETMEPPKCCTCGRDESWHKGSMHGFRPPLPVEQASEPCLSDIYSRMDVSGVFSNDLKLRFAEEIAKMKAVRDITQTDLAKAAGITQSRMSLIEGASENCTFRTVERIVRALNARIILRLEPVEDKNFGKDLTHYEMHIKPPSNGPGPHPACVSGDPDVNAASVASVTAGETAAPVSEPPIDCAYLALKAQNAALTAQVERLRDLIVLVNCREEYYRGERACFLRCDELVPLHSEARAIRAAREAGNA